MIFFFFSKTWSTHFLVESNKIENTSFPYKTAATAVTEANVTTSEWWPQNRPITKNGVLRATTPFLEILLQFKGLF